VTVEVGGSAVEPGASSAQAEGSRIALPSQRARRAWQATVENQLERLSDELATVSPPPDPGARAVFESYRRVVRRHLDRAAATLSRLPPIDALREWYSGTRIEIATASLHRASETLLMIQSPVALATELPDIQAAFESSLALDDPRRIELKPALDEAARILAVRPPPRADQATPAAPLPNPPAPEVSAMLRGRLRAARRAAHAVTDTAQAGVRRWRNALVWGGVALTALVLAVAVMHGIVPGFLSLKPSDGGGPVDSVAPWAVELVGAVGGALAALLALNRFSGFTDPFGLPTFQALLRIPTAAVTGLFGVLLMQSAALGAFQPQRDAGKVLAFAFVFGYAQEPLLRMIDRQAGKVLDPARDKSEPAKPSSPPAEQGAN
jgi:hypothetical protein